MSAVRGLPQKQVKGQSAETLDSINLDVWMLSPKRASLQVLLLQNALPQLAMAALRSQPHMPHADMDAQIA